MIGNHCRARVVKNKIAPPFRIAEFDIYFGKGIDRTGDLLELAVNSGAAEKSGSWYSFQETRLGQGRERSTAFLDANPDIRAAMEKETMLALGVADTAGDTSEGDTSGETSGEGDKSGGDKSGGGAAAAPSNGADAKPAAAKPADAKASAQKSGRSPVTRKVVGRK